MSSASYASRERPATGTCAEGTPCAAARARMGASALFESTSASLTPRSVPPDTARSSGCIAEPRVEPRTATLTGGASVGACAAARSASMCATRDATSASLPGGKKEGGLVFWGAAKRELPRPPHASELLRGR